MTLKECCDKATARLLEAYPASEVRWMVRIIFEHLKGYTPVDLVIKAQDPVSDFIAGKVSAVVNRLLAREPIQYIFGQAQFYGLKLKVTPDTLIPRPETEELVDMIVREAGERSDLRVLDIGTGSGCIAIALARNLRFPQVSAIDISPRALDVARENARDLRTRINFSCADALALTPPAAPAFDIIVSNPPYIARHEQADMDHNVLDHEPHSALFVPDSDPLVFYHSIARFALKALTPGGRIYFEINPLYAHDLSAFMQSCGWTGINLIPDTYRHIRFLSATNPSS